LSALPTDPLWPRAGQWITPTGRLPRAEIADLALLGVPTYRTSITPTSAHTTPALVRDALLRYSTWSANHQVDVAELLAADLGDVTEPDGPAGEARVTQAVADAIQRCRFLIALGGDNSLTYGIVRGIFGERLGECGVITIDAHHDIRDGISNGSPIRRLIEAGLPGANIVQIGIGDFSNSAQYASRAHAAGITAVSRSELRGADMASVAAHALDIAGAHSRPVFVDIDVDVCDLAHVPACPSAAPGGISADELRQLAFAFARDARVVGADIAEIDAANDAEDGRTVKLAALVVLEIAAGIASRE
jgi:formiminoglutamase